MKAKEVLKHDWDRFLSIVRFSLIVSLIAIIGLVVYKFLKPNQTQTITAKKGSTVNVIQNIKRTGTLFTEIFTDIEKGKLEPGVRVGIRWEF